MPAPSAGLSSLRRRRRSCCRGAPTSSPVIFVTAASTQFNTTGIEVAVHREANLERELNITGLANILTGALAGYAGCISVSRTILNFSSGGRGRLSGLTVAAISLLMLAVAPALLGYMPKFVLG